MKRIQAAAVTKTGRRRNNQDNFLLGERYAELNHDSFSDQFDGKSDIPFFAAVCDGMGGESSGERASYEACCELAYASERLSDSFASNKKEIILSILKANNRLCRIMKHENCGRMGSTVAAVLIQDGKLFFTNLGDSRIYLMRDGKLTQLTKDHSEGQTMVDAGILTPEQLKTHPSRNKLNRHLGIFEDEMLLECPVYNDIALNEGDTLLLCSDGVFGALDDDAMIAILSESASVNERALRLIDEAYASGSSDNMTAIVIDIEKSKSNLKPILFAAMPIALIAATVFAVNSIRKNGDSSYPSPSPVGTAEVTPSEQATELPTEPATAENTYIPTTTPWFTDYPVETHTPAPTETENAGSENSDTPIDVTSYPTAAATEVPTEFPPAALTEAPEPTPASTESDGPSADPQITPDTTSPADPVETPEQSDSTGADD